MTLKYFIKTFGCQQNKADSERVAAAFEARGMKPVKRYSDADHIVVNTCMVRQSVEDRVYGLVKNLSKLCEFKTPVRCKPISLYLGVCGESNFYPGDFLWSVFLPSLINLYSRI